MSFVLPTAQNRTELLHGWAMERTTRPARWNLLDPYGQVIVFVPDKGRSLFGNTIELSLEAIRLRTVPPEIAADVWTKARARLDWEINQAVSEAPLIGREWYACTPDIDPCFPDKLNHTFLLPNSNNLLWLFFPNIGNKDEGWGYVMPGWFDRDSWGKGGTWLDHWGNQVQPSLWTLALSPLPPYITPENPYEKT